MSLYLPTYPARPCRAAPHRPHPALRWPTLRPHRTSGSTSPHIHCAAHRDHLTCWRPCKTCVFTPIAMWHSAHTTDQCTAPPRPTCPAAPPPAPQSHANAQCRGPGISVLVGVPTHATRPLHHNCSPDPMVVCPPPHASPQRPLSHAPTLPHQAHTPRPPLHAPPVPQRVLQLHHRPPVLGVVHHAAPVNSLGREEGMCVYGCTTERS